MVRPAIHLSALTLIELLVVIMIIAILIGMLLVGIETMRQAVARTKTLSILGTVQAALQRTSTGAVPHPLTGTARVGTGNRRPPFYGLRGAATVANALDDAQQAIRAEESQVAPTLAGQLTLTTDRFSDPTVPLLFGLPRGALGVVGIETMAITDVVRVPASSSTVTAIDPAWRQVPRLTRFRYGSAIEDTMDIGPGGIDLLADPARADWEDISEAAIKSAMADGYDQLVSLGAIHRPKTGAALARARRLRVDTGTARARQIGDGLAWAAGRVQDDDGRWRPLLQRAPGIYDTYGYDVLIEGTADRWTVRSAGPDGCFVVHPGGNKIIDTVNPFMQVLSGDDQPATRDNITVGEP